MTRVGGGKNGFIGDLGSVTVCLGVCVTRKRWALYRRRGIGLCSAQNTVIMERYRFVHCTGSAQKMAIKKRRIYVKRGHIIMIDVTGVNLHHEIHSQSIIDFTRNNILIRKILLHNFGLV